MTKRGRERGGKGQGRVRQAEETLEGKGRGGVKQEEDMEEKGRGEDGRDTREGMTGR